MRFSRNSISPVVERTIRFLAPHFEISQKQLGKFPFPGIRESKLDRSYFFHTKNIIAFSKNDFGLDCISHEVGHYLHYHLASRAWEGVSPYEDDLAECVARYAEMIYLIREHPLTRNHINEYMKEFCRNGTNETLQKKCLKAYEMILYGKEKFGNDSLYPLSQLARIVEYKEITWISQTASALRERIRERLEKLALS